MRKKKVAAELSGENLNRHVRTGGRERMWSTRYPTGCGIAWPGCLQDVRSTRTRTEEVAGRFLV